MKIGLLCILLLVALAPLNEAMSRSDGHRTPHRHSQAVADKIVELRGRLLREMVGLNEEKANQVEQILKTFDDEHQAYTAMLDVARRAMHSLLEAESDDQEAYARAVEDVRVAHEYLSQLRDRQFRAMQKALQPKDQALFFESLGKLRHEVRKRMRRARRDHKRARGSLK